MVVATCAKMIDQHAVADCSHCEVSLQQPHPLHPLSIRRPTLLGFCWIDHVAMCSWWWRWKSFNKIKTQNRLFERSRKTSFKNTQLPTLKLIHHPLWLFSVCSADSLNSASRHHRHRHCKVQTPWHHENFMRIYPTILLEPLPMPVPVSIRDHCAALLEARRSCSIVVECCSRSIMVECRSMPDL